MEENEEDLTIKLDGNELPQLIQIALQKKLASTNGCCTLFEVQNYHEFFTHCSLQQVGRFTQKEEPFKIQDKNPRIFVNNLDKDVTQTLETKTTSSQMYSISSEKSFTLGLSNCIGAALCAEGGFEGAFEYSYEIEETHEKSSGQEWTCTLQLTIPPDKKILVSQNKIITKFKADCTLKVKIPNKFAFKCKWLHSTCRVTSDGDSNESLKCFTALSTQTGFSKSCKSQLSLQLNPFILKSTTDYDTYHHSQDTEQEKTSEDSSLHHRIVTDSTCHYLHSRRFKMFEQKSTDIKAEEVFNGKDCYQVLKKKFYKEYKTITCFIKCEVIRTVTSFESEYSQKDL